jgi:iron complex transport system substrate-binding protein
LKAAARTLVAIGLLLLGCQRSPQRASPARRVVSLSPSTTEALVAVGAGNQLVGRSRYCDWPPEVASIPSVGGFVDPNLEAIVALRPDLVTGARGPGGRRVADRLESLGIATYFPETESLDGIDSMILGLGARTNHEDSAKDVVAEIRVREARIRRQVGALPRRKALLVFGLEPIVVAGPGSFPDEMLRAAGATNVVTEGGGYPTLGIEHVLALAPEVIVDASMQGSPGSEHISKDTPAWRELPAVREGRVVAIVDPAVFRPGPRVAEGIAAIARAMHPDADARF